MTFTLLRTVRDASRNLTTVLALTAAFGVGVSLLGVTPVRAERQDTKTDATAYTIKRVYKAGDKDHYQFGVKMSMETPMGAVDIVQTMLMKETTKEAKDDGSTTSIFDFETASLTFNGMDIDITPMLPKITSTRDKTGKADVKVEGGNDQLMAQMGDQVKQYANFGTAFIPTKPVKVGDSWDVNASDFGGPDQKVKGKMTLVSVDTVKGVKVAKIKSVMDVTGAMDTSIHSESTTLIDLATGKAVDLKSKTEGTTAAGKISMEMTMKAVAPDDKGDAKETIKTDTTGKKPDSPTKKP